MAQPLIRISVRVEGQDEFNRVAKQYAQFNKRQPQEVAVAKAYFIDLGAMGLTKTTTKEQIAANLHAPSSTNPKVELAPILVNWNLAKKGKKGLTGEDMRIAAEKFIRLHQARTQAARSGWIAGAKKLDYYNKQGDVSFSKRFAPKKPQGVRQYGKEKGWAQVVNRVGLCSVTVANEFGKGKQASSTIDGVLQEGLQKAFNRETTSMISYINKKYQEQHDRMNKINTFR